MTSGRPAPAAASVRAAVTRAWRGVRWYARELSGEARWDDHLAHCARSGHEPMSRRAFERARSDRAERAVVDRCC